MKERPIIFQGDMVNAILAGKKTQTRRVMSVQPKSDKFELTTLISTTGTKRKIGKLSWCHIDPETLRIIEEDDRYFSCPYGRPGDQLWVRETWHTDTADLDKARSEHEDIMSPSPIYYKADISNKHGGFIWRPSIHMPRWASRIDLLVKNTRVERVQDISEEDAVREGFNDYADYCQTHDYSDSFDVTPEECPE